MFVFPIIDINVTNFCNYSCSYCTRTAQKNTKKIFIDFNYTIDLLKRIAQKHVIKTISICGNCEPTLHPELYQFLKLLSIFNCSIEIYSNLSASIDLYEHILKIKNIILIASYHNINGKLNNQFIKNFNKLNIKNNVLCNITIEPNYVKECLLVYKMLKSIYGSNCCHISLVDNYLNSYSYEEINMLVHDQSLNLNTMKTYTIIDNTSKILHINYDNKLKYGSYQSFIK